MFLHIGSNPVEGVMKELARKKIVDIRNFDWSGKTLKTIKDEIDMMLSSGIADTAIVQYDYGYDNIEGLQIISHRDETDDEYQARLKKWEDNTEKRRRRNEKKKKELEESTERLRKEKLALYKKLHEEFGDI